MKWWPRSLFGRTAITLGLAFLLLQIVALLLVYFIVLAPLAQRSADDLAALIVLSVQTWVELPPDTRPAFEHEMLTHHQMRIVEVATRGREPMVHFLNSNNIEAALLTRARQPVHLRLGKHGWVWATFSLGGHLMRVGFEARTYYLRALLTAAGMISMAALLTWLTSLMLMRRISMRLAQMGAATVAIGQGALPQPLPEDGETELAMLGGAFNRMAREVQELLANRTTLLAGISHDLRTPMARMRLSLALLPENIPVVQQMERDLEQMAALVDGFLDMARGMSHEVPMDVDVQGLLQQWAADAQRGGAQVICLSGDICRQKVAVHALQRVVMNLLENALRYGQQDGQPVELACVWQQGRWWVMVMDRGPGIPAAEHEAVFRPFYRLEPSRNQGTGGSGLGLAIARQIALAQGWEIRLEDRPGGGLLAMVGIG